MFYNYIIDSHNRVIPVEDSKSSRNSIKSTYKFNYLVKTSPIEIHMHGIGDYDFSEFIKEDLHAINKIAEEKHIFVTATGFLERGKIKQFQDYMRYFKHEKNKGALKNILGIALEGPLLSTTGGTPQPTTWLPTKKEWGVILNETDGYLKYIVLSPDAILPGGQFYKELDNDYPSLQWIIDKFYENQVMPSLGHFRKDNIEITISSIIQVVEMAKKSENYKPGCILVDHLFNDMPRNFKHTWRTLEEKSKKQEELSSMDIQNWSLDNIDEYLGEVPAILIKLSLRGDITVCLNFDGEHVAIEISKRIGEIMGYDGIIAMTDCASDTNIICGRQLQNVKHNTLLYQEEGIVAAGTTAIDDQIEKMRSVGISEDNIWKMIGFVPMNILMRKEDLENIPYTYVNEEGKRNYTAVSQF